MPLPPAPRAHKPPSKSRRASIGMLALSVLILLGILVGSSQWVQGTTHKLFFHAYYNEKALALIEGVNSIARGEAQAKLGELLEKPGEWVDLTGSVTGTANSMKLWESGDGFSPTVKVEARVLKDRLIHFAQQTPYKSVKEAKAESGVFANGHELAGKVEIKSSVSFELNTANFKVPERTVTAEYEFKRIQRTPKMLRHFVLFVKDAETGNDAHEDYETASGYNQVSNDMAGESNSGAIFVAPGEGSESLPFAANNAFGTTIGYVYLGSDKPIFLNLTAGNDQSDYSETFHLYKGESTNFYKLWGSDYSSFLEQANLGGKKDGGGGGGGLLDKFVSGVKSAWNSFTNLFSKMKDFIGVLEKLDQMEMDNPNMKSAGLPNYYVVRKDYGYAADWARFPQFGFGQAPFSSTLHLYGVKEPQSLGGIGVGGDPSMAPRSSWGATLVMGKVYRRCLSLSGYKQRRGQSDPTQDRRFEVQAGPIQYFKDLDDILKRKMDPRKTGPERPIWVWDNRVDWYRDQAGGQGGVTGTYFPISGYGLLGRLLPALPAFMKEEEKNLPKVWKHSIMPPKEISNDAEPDDVEKAAEISSKVNDLSGFPEHVKGGISPIILTMWKKGFFSRTSGTGPWIDPKGSPYYEELMRNYAYASVMTDQERQAAASAPVPAPTNGSTQGDPNADFSEGDILAALKEGDRLWSRLSTGLPAQQKIDPGAFGQESKSKSAFWKPSAGIKPAQQGIYPFSLPDPWSKKASGGGNSSGAPASEHPNNFQKLFDKKYGSKKQEVFDKYVRPIMTDPGRTLPYNYSMRFIYDDIKQLFLQGEKERAELLTSQVAPEVRDGIGYVIDGENEYLSQEDQGTGEGVKFDHAIDDTVLAEIHSKRGSSEYLKKGYFFMDDYGDATKSPKDIDLGELYNEGNRYCWKDLTEEEFRDRFGPAKGSDASRVRDVSFGNAVQVQGDLGIFAEGPTRVIGGGVILVDGTIKLTQSLVSSDPLTIIAKRVILGDGGSDSAVVQALIITDDLEVGGGLTVKGGVVAGKWNLSGGSAPPGKVLISYNSQLKKDESFVQVIEPRISKITISGSSGNLTATP